MVLNFSYKKLVTCSLVLYPILQIYGYSEFANVANILTIVLILFGLIRGEFKKLSLPKYLLLYYIVWIFSLFISGNEIKDLFVRLFGIGHSILLFSLFFSEFDKDFFVKFYKTVSFICIGYFFFQEITFSLTGYRPAGMLTFLPLSFEDQITDMQSFAETRSMAFRSSSFFSEPAHFAQFISPLLAYYLLYEHNIKKKLCYSIVISVVLVLLQSGNGYVCFVLVWLYWFISKVFFSKSPSKFIIIPIILFIFVLGGTSFMQSKYGEFFMYRTTELENTGESNSGFERIFRGYYVFNQYDFGEKIFGIYNFSTISNKIKQSPVSWAFGENDFYFNVVQNILIKTGFLGLIVFVLMLASLWRKAVSMGKAVLIMFVGLSFMAGIYFTPTMAFYLIFPFKFQNQNIYK